MTTTLSDIYEVPDLERAVIEVFGGCNYKCQMCPQSTGRGHDWVRKMPLDLFEKTLDQLPGSTHIQFSLKKRS